MVAIVLLVTIQGGSGSLAGLLAVCITASSHARAFLVTGVFLAVAGCGPLLTGGISSRLAAIVEGDQKFRDMLKDGMLQPMASVGLLGPL